MDGAQLGGGEEAPFPLSSRVRNSELMGTSVRTGKEREAAALLCSTCSPFCALASSDCQGDSYSVDKG